LKTKRVNPHVLPLSARRGVGARRKIAKYIRCRKGGISDPVSTGMLF